MSHIKNIIFDLGEVILNIDFEASERKFRSLGIDNFNEFYSKARQISLFDRLEEGKISPEVFRNEIRILTSKPLTDDDIDKSWNSMILDFPRKRIRFLERLMTNYRIFLLSNTNKIHFEYFSKKFRNEYGYEFSRLFEKTYYSFEAGLRKPDKKMFLKIIQENLLLPSETLYIDDMEIHIKAAKELGFQAFVLNEEEEIYDVLQSNLSDFQ